MDEDFDLRHFSGTTRLFPLGGLVMFPHVVLPLHIFEPRYRQMTEHALTADRLITIVQSLPPSAGKERGNAKLAGVGCLGRIIRHERLQDGRFNFLLVGKTRVRIVREIDCSTLYRQAEVELLDDLDDVVEACPMRDQLVGQFEKLHSAPLDPELGELLRRDTSLGALSDILAHAVRLPPEQKQLLLDQPHVPTRSQCLLDFLAAEILQRPLRPGPGRSFPASFSAN